MSTKGPDEKDALPKTSLADLVQKAKEKVGAEPDKHGPSATLTLAAIVRDLKGMPEISITRESNMRIRLARRGKIGALVLEYLANITAIELTYDGFPGAPTDIKQRRYTLDSEQTGASWHRLDRGGELIEDVREGMLRLYPELGDG